MNRKFENNHENITELSALMKTYEDAALGAQSSMAGMEDGEEDFHRIGVHKRTEAEHGRKRESGGDAAARRSFYVVQKQKESRTARTTLTWQRGAGDSIKNHGSEDQGSCETGNG